MAICILIIRFTGKRKGLDEIVRMYSCVRKVLGIPKDKIERVDVFATDNRYIEVVLNEKYEGRKKYYIYRKTC